MFSDYSPKSPNLHDSAKTVSPKHDYESTTELALSMAKPYAGTAKAYLIQAADKKGRVVWYYLPESYMSKRGLRWSLCFGPAEDADSVKETLGGCSQ